MTNQIKVTVCKCMYEDGNSKALVRAISRNSDGFREDNLDVEFEKEFTAFNLVLVRHKL